MIDTLARRADHSLEMTSRIRARAETPDFLSGFFVRGETKKPCGLVLSF